MMMNMTSKVKTGINDRLEAMTVKHHELEEDLKNKEARLHTYDKFATLHREMNHHCYKAQYYWTLFFLRRIIFITVCIKSNDTYWQTATFVVLSMICSCYVYAIFPFKYSRKNYVENFNELMIFMCALIMQVLGGYTLPAGSSSSKGGISPVVKTRFGASYYIVACISLMVAVNVFFASSDVCHQVILHLKKWYLRLRANQNASLLLVAKQKALAKKAMLEDEVNMSERKLIDNFSIKGQADGPSPSDGSV